MKQTYFSHGKLLLSGEYLVLEGALALALPTTQGQQMEVELLPGSGNIHWMAMDVDGHIWLNCSFILQDTHLIPVAMGNPIPSAEVASLMKLLENALSMNPALLNNQTDYEVSTRLQFPREWGLGSSSTLIANIAAWAGVNGMDLFFRSWEGSGYDVAVGMEGSPIFYQRMNGQPRVQKIGFQPSFKRELFFVYLGKKQDSRKEVRSYQDQLHISEKPLERISEISRLMAEAQDLKQFEELMTEQEQILSRVLNRPPVKQLFFSDYPGAIKSLGAWGGDFVLATGEQAKTYFPERGYPVVIGFGEMIKNS